LSFNGPSASPLGCSACSNCSSTAGSSAVRRGFLRDWRLCDGLFLGPQLVDDGFFFGRSHFGTRFGKWLLGRGLFLDAIRKHRLDLD
jgi:hypothetical protein